MPFINSEKLPKMELFPGALSGILAGDNIMLSFLELAAGGTVPQHSHPHEQAGLMISGSLRFTIGTEEQVMAPGDAFLIPPNVAHSGEVLEGPARVLDIFCPVREDYVEKYNRYTETGDKTVWK
jgi:quercetin dioxygenase-like cupin family protein